LRYSMRLMCPCDDNGSRHEKITGSSEKMNMKQMSEAISSRITLA